MLILGCVIALRAASGESRERSGWILANSFEQKCALQVSSRAMGRLEADEAMNLARPDAL
jgi:hypothetical protein